MRLFLLLATASVVCGLDFVQFTKDVTNHSKKSCEKLYSDFKCVWELGRNMTYRKLSCSGGYYDSRHGTLPLESFNPAKPNSSAHTKRCIELKSAKAVIICDFFGNTGKEQACIAAASMAHVCGLGDYRLDWGDENKWKTTWQPCLSDVTTTGIPIETTPRPQDIETTEGHVTVGSGATTRGDAKGSTPQTGDQFAVSTGPAETEDKRKTSVTPEAGHTSAPQPPPTTEPAATPSYTLIALGVILGVAVLVGIGFAVWRKLRTPPNQRRQEPSFSVAFEAGNVTRERACRVIPPRDPDEPDTVSTSATEDSQASPKNSPQIPSVSARSSIHTSPQTPNPPARSHNPSSRTDEARLSSWLPRNSDASVSVVQEVAQAISQHGKDSLQSTKKQLDDAEREAKQAISNQVLSEAKELAEQTEGKSYFVHRFEDGCPVKALDAAAKMLKAKVNVVFSVHSVDKVLCMIAVDKETAKKIPAKEIANEVAVQVGGRGGGKDINAQVTGDDPSKVDGLMAHLRNLLNRRLGGGDE